MLWYVGYGSNLDRARFMQYLTGGRAAGALRSVPGARDASLPSQERAVLIPGRMFFGWTSVTWGGGVSFLDAEADDSAYGRAYLVTEQQFADIAAQEMHQDPGADLDLAHVLERRRHTYGPGRYETLHLVGELDGMPMVTFSVDEPDLLERNKPARRYLATVARGLRETHDLSAGEATEHLLSRPGIGTWTAADLVQLIETGPDQPG